MKKNICTIFINMKWVEHVVVTLEQFYWLCYNIFMILTIIFIIIMCVDNILPFILSKFYKGYSHKAMALSVLGAKQSPVKWYYNVWCVISGLCFVACSILIAIFNTIGLTVAIAVLLSIYGIACEVVSGFFPLNERREDVDVSSKIHGGFSAIGFMCLLPVPLLIGIYYIENLAIAIVSITSFVFALICFCLFVMGDKEKFKNTPIAWEGLWQRLVMLFCYIPIITYSILF